MHKGKNSLNELVIDLVKGVSFLGVNMDLRSLCDDFKGKDIIPNT